MNRESHSSSDARRHRSRAFAVITTFVVVALAVFFGAQLITKTGFFKHPGTLTFTDDVSESERDFIAAALDGRELQSDLTISTVTKLTRADESTSEVLYDILLPTTDFYDSTISLPASNLIQAISDSSLFEFISIWNLRPERRLLAVDDQYFFDTFTSGAVFKYYQLSTENGAELAEIHALLTDAIDPFPTSADILSLAQTGVTALSRRMNDKLTAVGDASYFAANIGNFLSSFDLTHTSNESSFSDLANDSNICSKPQMIDTLTAIGLDIVELTGNHNQDCGDEAAIATIDQYQSLGIQTVGGGKTATEAAIPLELSQKSTTITFLAYNLSTGGYTTDDTPGANFFTLEKVTADINAAKARGDFVIVDMQYYECNNYDNTADDPTCDRADSAAGDQIGVFRNLIDLGADLVVGTAAHQPQTYELYGNGIIFYGLGNLFFDQSWWPGTTRSLVLVHYFYKNQYLQTRIVPTIYDDNFQTTLMNDADASAFLARLASVRPAQ